MDAVNGYQRGHKLGMLPAKLLMDNDVTVVTDV
jgi:hypothetical protein